MRARVRPRARPVPRPTDRRTHRTGTRARHHTPSPGHPRTAPARLQHKPKTRPQAPVDPLREYTRLRTGSHGLPPRVRASPPPWHSATCHASGTGVVRATRAQESGQAKRHPAVSHLSIHTSGRQNERPAHEGRPTRHSPTTRMFLRNARDVAAREAPARTMMLRARLHLLQHVPAPEVAGGAAAAHPPGAGDDGATQAHTHGQAAESTPSPGARRFAAAQCCASTPVPSALA